VHLPEFVVTCFGVLLIAGHNLFDSVSWDHPLWSILYAPAGTYQELSKTSPSAGCKAMSQLYWLTPELTGRTLPSIMATIMRFG